MLQRNAAIAGVNTMVFRGAFRGTIPKWSAWVILSFAAIAPSCQENNAVYLCSAASDNYYDFGLVSGSDIGFLDIPSPTLGLPNNAGIALDVVYRVNGRMSLKIYYSLPVSMVFDHAAQLSLEYFQLFGKNNTATSSANGVNGYFELAVRLDDDSKYILEESDTNSAELLNSIASVVISYVVEESESISGDLKPNVHRFPLGLDPLEMPGQMQFELDKKEIKSYYSNNAGVDITITGKNSEYLLGCIFDFLGGA